MRDARILNGFVGLLLAASAPSCEEPHGDYSWLIGEFSDNNARGFSTSRYGEVTWTRFEEDGVAKRGVRWCDLSDTVTWEGRWEPDGDGARLVLGQLDGAVWDAWPIQGLNPDFVSGVRLERSDWCDGAKVDAVIERMDLGFEDFYETLYRGAYCPLGDTMECSETARREYCGPGEEPYCVSQ